MMVVSQHDRAMLRPALKKLADLEALEQDWDSYGALRPSAPSLTIARSIMLRMVKRFGERGIPGEVMPIADGGVQLEWQGGSGTLALNVAPDAS
jgi:hypothetical protein